MSLLISLFNFGLGNKSNFVAGDPKTKKSYIQDEVDNMYKIKKISMCEELKKGKVNILPNFSANRDCHADSMLVLELNHIRAVTSKEVVNIDCTAKLNSVSNLLRSERHPRALQPFIHALLIRVLVF